MFFRERLEPKGQFRRNDFLQLLCSWLRRVKSVLFSCFQKQRNKGIKTRYLKISATWRSKSPFLKGLQDSRSSPRWKVFTLILRGTKNHENLVSFSFAYSPDYLLSNYMRYKRLCKSVTELDLEYNTAHTDTALGSPDRLIS